VAAACTSTSREASSSSSRGTAGALTGAATAAGRRRPKSAGARALRSTRRAGGLQTSRAPPVGVGQLNFGPRRSASSNLAWYEPLLVARVHPVMSVIAPTATGLLCYVGRECNCYVKTVEWFRGVPGRAARREVVLHRRSCAPPMARARLDAPEPSAWPRRRLRTRGQAMVHLALPEAAVADNSSDGPACTGATPSSPPSPVVESNGTCRVTTMGTCSPRADLSVKVFNFLHIFRRARLGVVSRELASFHADALISKGSCFSRGVTRTSVPCHTLTFLPLASVHLIVVSSDCAFRGVAAHIAVATLAWRQTRDAPQLLLVPCEKNSFWDLHIVNGVLEVLRLSALEITRIKLRQLCLLHTGQRRSNDPV